MPRGTQPRRERTQGPRQVAPEAVPEGPKEERPVEPAMIKPSIPRFDNPERDPALDQQQHDASRNIGLGGNESRENDGEG